MSSNNQTPPKNISLVDTLMNEINNRQQPSYPAPVPPEEIEKFQNFYGLVGSALWDLFLTGHVEEEKKTAFDHFFVPMENYYFIGICSGFFEEVPFGDNGLDLLTVSESEWVKDDHKKIDEFFQSLVDILEEKCLEGIVLEDREDMFILKVSNPFCLVRLIETYVTKHDVLTLDEMRPEDLKQKSKKITPSIVKGLAAELREAAQYSWDTDNYSVSSDKHIDIRYYPPTAAPTIDNSDIILIEAQMVEETAPFSLQLIKNTYADCLGKEPQPHCGLTLLH